MQPIASVNITITVATIHSQCSAVGAARTEATTVRAMAMVQPQVNWRLGHDAAQLGVKTAELSALLSALLGR